MGLESATFINDLVTTNPVAGDNVSQGDDHLRLIKQVMKDSLPSISRAIYLEQASVDLASATTPDLSTPASNYINITGTTQIDGFATEPAGFLRWLRFDGALTLNYNGTSHILPSGDDITTEAGDHALVLSLGSGNWRYVLYHRADGTALVAAVIPTATESVEGISDLATDAEIRASTAGAHVITAADLETAAAAVALTETSGAVAVNWASFFFGTVTIDQDTVISNPTNGKPGNFRHILVTGNNTTDRTITFGNQFLGEVPTITDCDSTRSYLISIMCITTSWFIASAKRASGT